MSDEVGIADESPQTPRRDRLWIRLAALAALPAVLCAVALLGLSASNANGLLGLLAAMACVVGGVTAARSLGDRLERERREAETARRELAAELARARAAQRERDAKVATQLETARSAGVRAGELTRKQVEGLQQATQSLGSVYSQVEGIQESAGSMRISLDESSSAITELSCSPARRTSPPPSSR